MSTDMTPPAAAAATATAVDLTDAPSAAPASASVEPAAPRVRGAAIIWGLLFAAIAFAGIWTLTDDDRRSAAADAITTLTPGTALALGLLALGVLVLVTGAVGLIRHAQRRAAASRA